MVCPVIGLLVGAVATNGTTHASVRSLILELFGMLKLVRLL